MFAFQLLGAPLADDMLVGGQVPMIGTPAVGVKAANSKGHEPRFELQQRLIRPPAKDIRSYPARLMSQRSPQPPGVFLAANKRPHLVQFRCRYLANHHCGRCSLTNSQQGGVHLVEHTRFFLRALITVMGLTPRTRAVSRMPLPLSAMSTICRLTSGNRPVL